MNYLNSGVNIDKANQWTDIIKFRLNNNANIGAFAGVFPLNLQSHSQDNTELVACTDGVGTKIKIAQLVQKYDTIGIDLVAMCINDLIVMHATPLFFLDYISIGKLDLEITSDILKGIQEGCRLSGNIPILGGETAEMPIYSNEYLDLAGFSVGIRNKNDLAKFCEKEIEEGDIIIGLPSSGVHSNGFSLINQIIKNLFKKDEVSPDDIKLLEELLIPTRIYYNDIRKLEGSIYAPYIKKYCHITGGGFIDNIARILPDQSNSKNTKKLTYELTNLPEIPEIFKWIYRFSEMSEEDMFKTYNCGIGFIAILDHNAKNILNKMTLYHNDNKPLFYQIGKIIKANNPVIINYNFK